MLTLPSNWVEIINRLDLSLLGSKMRFCISGYWHYLVDRKYKVFSFKSESNEIFVAGVKLSITHNSATPPVWSVDQVRGYKNKPAPIEVERGADIIAKCLNRHFVDIEVLKL